MCFQNISHPSFSMKSQRQFGNKLNLNTSGYKRKVREAVTIDDSFNNKIRKLEADRDVTTTLVSNRLQYDNDKLSLSLSHKPKQLLLTNNQLRLTYNPTAEPHNDLFSNKVLPHVIHMPKLLCFKNESNEIGFYDSISEKEEAETEMLYAIEDDTYSQRVVSKSGNLIVEEVDTDIDEEYNNYDSTSESNCDSPVPSCDAWMDETSMAMIE